jgi:nitrogen fixation protein NifZ
MSGRSADDVNELCGPPVLEVGQKVRCLRGQPVGEILIHVGDVGYVHSIGTYLQMYYIYGIDFYERRAIVGMRSKELEVVDAYANAPKSATPNRAVGAP